MVASLFKENNFVAEYFTATFVLTNCMLNYIDQIRWLQLFVYFFTHFFAFNSGDYAYR